MLKHFTSPTSHDILDTPLINGRVRCSKFYDSQHESRAITQTVAGEDKGDGSS